MNLNRSLAYGLIVWAAALGMSQYAVADDTSTEQSPYLTEILVTAQKRTEKLQDVPAAIDYVSAESLESQGLLQISDYAKEIPGLNALDPAAPGWFAPVIRGVSVGLNGGGTATLYLDDIPMSPSASGATLLSIAFDPDVSDMDHLEVLEGPQSSLYGANSLSGVIKFVTKQPDLNSLTGSVRIDGSKIDDGGAGYGVHASINLPVVTDSVAIRISAYDREDPGFVNNLYYGAKDVNWSIVKGGQFSALFKISDDLQTTLSGLTQYISTPSIQQFNVNPQTLQPSLGGLNYTSPIQPSLVTETNTVSDVTKWDMHFATLTNVVAYTTQSGDSVFDATFFQAIYGAPAEDTFIARDVDRSDRWSDELRWASAPGKLEWLLAGFVTDETDTEHYYNYGGNSKGQLLPSTDPWHNLLTTIYDNKFVEGAFFGDLTYHLTDQIQATVGFRHSENHASFYNVDSGVANGPTPAATAASSRDSANTYLVTVSYKPQENTMLYLRAASGYGPGGSYALTAMQRAAGASGVFGPDYLWNYEAGIKGSLWDQRINYSADVFHMVWTKMQLDIIEDTVYIPINVGSAKSDGIETSLRLSPFRGLNVSLNGAYVDATITSDIPSVNAVSGESLPFSAKWNASTIADYKFATANALSPTVGLTYAFHGSELTNFTGGASLVASGVHELPAYRTLDLRSGVEWSRYSVLARVNNITNAYGLTWVGNALEAGYPQVARVVQPRTFGVSFAAHF
jgi:iron complex outermembrane recepter protein